MAVQVYNPAVEVTLFKMVARTDGVSARYASLPRSLDLTQFLGDAGSVRTYRGVRGQPGAFSVSFADKMDPTALDTVSALVEPMDMIEIRMARQPHLWVGQKLPLVMRGWVSGVRRSEMIGESGEPRREVIIQGQDSMKLWLIHQVLLQIAAVTETAFLTTFQLQAAIGLDVGVLKVSDFMTKLVEKVMNPKIAALAAFSSQQIGPFTVQATVPNGSVIPQTVQTFTGPLWGLVEMVADRPFNEVFIRDHEDGPVFVFRPVPFRDLSGKYIMPGADDPGTVGIDIADVVSIYTERTDYRVANFFWVPPGTSSLDTNAFSSVAAMQQAAQINSSGGNNNPVLYGRRQMQASTALVPDDLQSLPSLLPPGERGQANSAYIQWYRVRAQQLEALNKDNSALEEGLAEVKGNEALIPGQYLQITRGDVISTAYISDVAQNFMPLNRWSTTVTLERGDGFLARDKLAASPYIAEGRKGPYS